MYKLYKYLSIFRITTFAAALLVVFVSMYAIPARFLITKSSSARFYHISGTKMIAPNGSTFKVKGVDSVFGYFAGGDPTNP
jgi:hypothetical protein